MKRLTKHQPSKPPNALTGQARDGVLDAREMLLQRFSVLARKVTQAREGQASVIAVRQSHHNSNQLVIGYVYEGEEGATTEAQGFAAGPQDLPRCLSLSPGTDGQKRRPPAQW